MKNIIKMHNKKSKISGIVVEKRNINSPHNVHWHDYLEIEIIVDGLGTQILNGKKCDLSEGCITVIRMTDFHEISPSNNITLINISIDMSIVPEQIINKLYSIKDNIFIPSKGYLNSTIEALGNLLLSESNSDNPDSEYVNSLLNCILLKIANSKGYIKSNIPTSESLNKSLIYLRTNFRSNPKLNEVARYLNYTPEYFCTLFHKELGISYTDYLSQLKINHAKKLLSTTSLTIESIGIASGFSSSLSFRRVFKKFEQKSPSEYRKIFK